MGSWSNRYSYELLDRCLPVHSSEEGTCGHLQPRDPTALRSRGVQSCSVLCGGFESSKNARHCWIVRRRGPQDGAPGWQWRDLGCVDASLQENVVRCHGAL